MSNQKYLTIRNLKLTTPNEGIIDMIVTVRDEFAMVRFSDRKVARRIFESERKNGSQVLYQERLSGFTERFEGKKKEEILEILREQITKAGGKIKKWQDHSKK